MNKLERKGIDISEWQGMIDWKKVKESDVQFVMIRIGYGTLLGGKLDKNFNTNITGALTVGLSVGIYFYSYAVSLERVHKEAQFVIEQLQPYKKKIHYPIVFDIEDKSQKELGKSLLTNMTHTFCTVIAKAGFYPGIYTSLDWCTNKLDMKNLHDFDLWLAQWGKQPTYKGEFGLWQYSEKGTVNGINGMVDLNLCYKDYPFIVKTAGWNGFEASGKKVKEVVCTLRKGDTGIYIKYLQNALNDCGYPVEVDGNFGELTLAAVKAFQKKYDLMLDGIVGEKTWDKLNSHIL